MSTTIEWTDETWNPTRGCSRVSEGCRHCYAETIAARFSNPGNTFHGFAERTADGPRWTGDVVLLRDRLREPLTWKTPRRIFVNSMSDLFHENLPDEAIDQVFAVMALASRHTFQVLTKRAERMFDYCSARHGVEHVSPLPNVWLGVSVENQHWKSRIDELRETPAAVHFLSIEPLLEDIGVLDLRGIQWVIVGGESGPESRSIDLAWIYAIVQQCKSAGVPCFVKQLGANWYDSERYVGVRGSCVVPVDSTFRWMKLANRKGGDPNEWPADLRVRQFPEDARYF